MYSNQNIKWYKTKIIEVKKEAINSSDYVDWMRKSYNNNGNIKKTEEKKIITTIKLNRKQLGTWLTCRKRMIKKKTISEVN